MCRHPPAVGLPLVPGPLNLEEQLEELPRWGMLEGGIQGCRERGAREGPGVQCSERTLLPSPKDLVNIEMFLTAKEVEESLERRETATCLAWCHDNKSRLRKMKVCRLAGRGGAGAGPAPARNPRACTCEFGVLCFGVRGWGCWVWCWFRIFVLVAVFGF